MDKLKVEYVPVDSIKAYKNNAKIHTADQIEQIKKSIAEFGMNDPIAVWKNNEIIEGHGRLEACQELGIKEVPIIRLDELTDDKRKAYALVHNQLTMNTGFDDDILNIELGDIDMDLGDFGFEKQCEDDNVEIVEDEPPEPPESTEVKEGDVYKLGEHYVMCGDSTNEEDIGILMGEEKYKVMFTSPPYNMNGGMYENYKDNKESREYIEFNIDVFEKWKKKCNGYIFWNISYNKNSRWEFIEVLYNLMKSKDMRFLELIVWDKGHGMPIVSKDMLTREYEDIMLMAKEDAVGKEIEMYYLGTSGERAVFNKRKGEGISNYWRVSTNNTQLKNHKACNPVELSAKAIRLCSDRGDVVADCFGGSGTTLISAEQLGRKCYTMELDPVYVDVIIKRWENFTGQKSVKVR